MNKTNKISMMKPMFKMAMQLKKRSPISKGKFVCAKKFFDLLYIFHSIYSSMKKDIIIKLSKDLIIL